MQSSRQGSLVSKTFIFTLILFIAISCQLSVDNYLPSLPYLTQAFKVQAATLRLTVVVFMIGAGLASFFFGVLSDKLGRKHAFVYALCLFLVGNGLCMLAQNAMMLMAGRLLQGIGTGGCLTLVRVVLCDVTEDQAELAYLGSYLSVAISTVPTLSPTLGAFLFVHLGWRSNFILLFLIAVIAVIFTLKMLHETQVKNDTENVSGVMCDIKEILSHKVFLGYLSAAGLMTTAALALMSVGPHLFQVSLALSPMQYGYVTFFIGLSMIFGSYGNAILIKRLGLRLTVYVGLVITVFASFAMVLAYYLGFINVIAITIPAMLYLFGGDFISTNAYAGAMSSLKFKAGTATALYTSLQLLFAGLVNFMIAYLPDNNQLPLSLIFLVIAGVLVFIIKIVLRDNLSPL